MWWHELSKLSDKKGRPSTEIESLDRQECARFSASSSHAAFDFAAFYPSFPGPTPEGHTISWLRGLYDALGLPNLTVHFARIQRLTFLCRTSEQILLRTKYKFIFQQIGAVTFVSIFPRHLSAVWRIANRPPPSVIDVPLNHWAAKKLHERWLFLQLGKYTWSRRSSP